MSRLPRRRALRLVVQDAIDDRREMLDCDPSIRAETQAAIDAYRSLSTRLADDAPPLSAADRETLAMSCMHARIWRETFLDANRRTGDRQVIHDARMDIEVVTRTEAALGVVRHDPWATGTSVSIQELRARQAA